MADLRLDSTVNSFSTGYRKHQCNTSGHWLQSGVGPPAQFPIPSQASVLGPQLSTRYKLARQGIGTKLRECANRRHNTHNSAATNQIPESPPPPPPHASKRRHAIGKRRYRRTTQILNPGRGALAEHLLHVCRACKRTAAAQLSRSQTRYTLTQLI